MAIVCESYNDVRTSHCSLFVAITSEVERRTMHRKTIATLSRNNCCQFYLCLGGLFSATAGPLLPDNIAFQPFNKMWKSNSTDSLSKMASVNQETAFAPEYSGFTPSGSVSYNPSPVKEVTRPSVLRRNSAKAFYSNLLSRNRDHQHHAPRRLSCYDPLFMLKDKTPSPLGRQISILVVVCFTGSRFVP